MFNSYTSGAHSISGFDPTQDLIALDKSTFASFADLQSHITGSGGGSLIALDGTSSLLIQNVAPDALKASDFSFV